jgi:hypothetical protein
MTDQEFRDMLLSTLADIKEQGKERYDRLEKKLDATEVQEKENNDRLEKKLDAIDTRVGRVERDVGWVKGKLESKRESRSEMSPIFISTGAAIAAVIIVLIALFN